MICRNLLTVWLLIGMFAPGMAFAEGRQLIFGRVQDDPVRAIQDRQEFVDYLAKKLAPVGITGGRILVLDKMHLLSQAIREGRVDVFHDSIVPRHSRSAGAGSLRVRRSSCSITASGTFCASSGCG